MALLFLCLIFGTGRTQKIEAAVQNVPESLEEESRLDTVGTDQETERAAVREKKGQQEKEAGDTETDQAAAAQDELLAELDFDAIQQEVDSLLSSQQFSFAGTVRSLLQDGDPFRTFRAGNAVLSCAKTAFLAQKGLMKELFLLVLAGAVLGSFSSLFEGKQVRDASFYMVYLLALALILKNFPVERGKPESCHHIAGRFYADPDAVLLSGGRGRRGRIISRDVFIRCSF